ncbi:hypothetical protein J8273_5142 [Carpediemonas membranifera]|uniref:BNR repeat protein n=1 Tax=Carpediemonas membranifera TaxID=201153 RepID=A0A8J6AR46_9EUKA|nr:hypothetical protein J8273_5142 [Carpediemonas membranifera]|eukprot:KAG9392161.1 hypothetical protein J8273_5142 [Carpediemonas membranifera]
MIRTILFVALIAYASCMTKTTVGTIPNGDKDGSFFPMNVIADATMIPIAVGKWAEGDWDTKIYIYTSSDNGKTWSHSDTIVNDAYPIAFPQAMNDKHLIVSASDPNTYATELIDYSRTNNKLTPGHVIRMTEETAGADLTADHIVSITPAGKVEEYVRSGDKLVAGVTDTVPVDSKPIGLRIVDDDMVLIDTNGTAVIATRTGGAWKKTQSIPVPAEYSMGDDSASSGQGIVVYHYENMETGEFKPSFVIFQRSGTQLTSFKLDITDAMLNLKSQGIYVQLMQGASPAVVDANTIEIPIICLTNHNSWAITKVVVGKTGSSWRIKSAVVLDLGDYQIMEADAVIATNGISALTYLHDTQAYSLIVAK